MLHLKATYGWILCILLPVTVIGGLQIMRRDFKKPNFQWPIQMAKSPAYEAYETNPVFANGAAMQYPPDGTIARGSTPFHYDTTETDRLRAGKELKNPYTGDKDLGRGRTVYETYCLVCHGVSGAGDGPIIPKFPNPPSYRTEQSRTLSDGEMFHIITLGRGKMSGYASLVGWDDRWKAILYVRQLQK